MNKRLLLFSLIIVLASCESNWQKKSDIVSAVWSDDGTQYAFLRKDWEAKHTFLTGTEVKNEKFKIVLTNETNSIFSELPVTIEDEVLNLFYMKSAGYIITGSERNKFYIYNLQGGLIKTIEPFNENICPTKLGSFQHLYVVPSLDGSRVAVVQTIQSCNVFIQILDATNNFSVIEEQELPIVEFLKIAWISNDSFLIEACIDFCGSVVYKVELGAQPQAIANETNALAACMFTATTSSFIRNDGKILFISNGKVGVGKLGEGSFMDADLPAEYYLPGCNLMTESE